MDQDAFRKLLSGSSTRPSAPKSQRPSSFLPPRTKVTSKAANDDTSKKQAGTFKPRKMKKGADGEAYRDRAAERRQGVEGDFAQVEAVLADFEKQNAEDEDKEAVEARRRYLGGDAAHSVLVKGLDVALLEQTRAAAAATSELEGDEKLESVLLESNALDVLPSEPRIGGKASGKKTREELVRELKEAREKTKKGADVVGETKVVSTKFKPIGFKPIAAKTEKEGAKKRKRKKVEDVQSQKNNSVKPTADTMPSEPQAGPSTSPPKKNEAPPAPPPDPVEEEVDIFADAGAYEGVDFDDEGEDGEVNSKDDDDNDPVRGPSDPESGAPPPRRKWFDDEEDMAHDKRLPQTKTSSRGPQRPEPSETRRSREADDDNDEEDGPPSHSMRLVPLASSAIPSVRDILAANEALEAEDKRRARKDKRKAGGGRGDGDGGSDDDEGGSKKKKKVSEDTKLSREVKRIKAYTDKKGVS